MLPFYLKYKDVDLLGVTDVKKSRSGKWYARVSHEPTQWCYHENLAQCHWDNPGWNVKSLPAFVRWVLEDGFMDEHYDELVARCKEHRPNGFYIYRASDDPHTESKDDTEYIVVRSESVSVGSFRTLLGGMGYFRWGT